MDDSLRLQILDLLLRAGPPYSEMPLWQFEYRFLEADRHGKLLLWPEYGVLTWAFLDDNAKQKLFSDVVIGGDEFMSEEGELWILNFVAPYGGAMKMVRQAREYFANRYGDKITGHWRRPQKDPLKIGAAIARTKNVEPV